MLACTRLFPLNACECGQLHACNSRARACKQAHDHVFTQAHMSVRACTCACTSMGKGETIRLCTGLERICEAHLVVPCHPAASCSAPQPPVPPPHFPLPSPGCMQCAATPCLRPTSLAAQVRKATAPQARKTRRIHAPPPSRLMSLRSPSPPSLRPCPSAPSKCAARPRSTSHVSGAWTAAAAWSVQFCPTAGMCPTACPGCLQRGSRRCGGGGSECLLWLIGRPVARG